MKFLEQQPSGATHFLPQNKVCNFAWVKVTSCDCMYIQCVGGSKDDNVWRKCNDKDFVATHMMKI